MNHMRRAAREGDLSEVQRLVGQDPGLLDARDDAGNTPLLHASSEGHVGVVRWLLDEGAAINQQQDRMRTALWCACSDGHAPMVRLLVERGADPSLATSWGSTPLMVASEKGHPEVVRFLLGHRSAKASINHRDAGDRTAFWEACYYGQAAVGEGSQPHDPRLAGTAPPPWPSPRSSLIIPPSPPRAAGSASRR
jgi:uncharacterized protein